jgi:hypothetical protein
MDLLVCARRASSSIASKNRETLLTEFLTTPVLMTGVVAFRVMLRWNFRPGLSIEFEREPTPGAKRMQRVLKRFALAVAAPLIGALLLCTPGHTQNYAQAPKAPGATRTVNLSLEQRHTIRELVKELKVETSKDDLKVAAGDELPGQIQLQPVPPLIGQKVPSIKSHRLYVTQHQVIIVDPADQKVVEVIE